MADEATRKVVAALPLLRTAASPRDRELWVQRLKEEYQALIKYVENNKNADNDWFRLESNKEGTRWFGKCWYIHDLLKYEFAIEFDIPVTYPGTAPEIAIPELDGKTAKMYRGGKICLTEHFRPLWARNVPKFGLAHLMALGVSVGESRGSVWGWRCGATHGICSHSAAGPLAGRGDPRPHRQGPGPAQGEMTGADPGPPLAGAGLSLRAIPTPSKSDSPIPRSSLPALFPPFLQ
uniref:Ubiquitin-fold modifier-conjugating enzyme 1 n=1 Tax=Apteryx owenii TaxID=8824 RepID=A0A8B9S322_APTOW